MAKFWNARRWRLGLGGVGVLVLGGALGAVVLGAPSQSAALVAGQGGTGGTITVTGTASASATPDEMTLSIGVSHLATSAAGALARANAETARLEQMFLAAGVPRADLQTSDLQLNPNEDSAGNVTDYQASEQLAITLSDLARAGATIDDATRAVGNDVTMQGVSFTVAHEARLLAAARAAAMRNALAEATALAHAGGEQLGSIRTVVARGDESPPVLPFAAASAAFARSAPVPVAPGTTTVTASVTVDYSLVP